MTSATDKMSKTPGQEAKNTMPDRMSKASATHSEVPKKGDAFRCDKCGMAIQVTASCGCKDASHVHFECCGQEMAKA